MEVRSLLFARPFGWYLNVLGQLCTWWLTPEFKIMLQALCLQQRLSESLAWTGKWRSNTEQVRASPRRMPTRRNIWETVSCLSRCCCSIIGAISWTLCTASGAGACLHCCCSPPPPLSLPCNPLQAWTTESCTTTLVTERPTTALQTQFRKWCCLYCFTNVVQSWYFMVMIDICASVFLRFCDVKYFVCYIRTRT